MYTLYKFHFLNGISEINQLFDDILIIWPAPVYIYIYIYMCVCKCIHQGGWCSAEFSSNPNQTHLKQLIEVLLGILQTSRQVCWGKLKLDSAGQRPSRTKFEDPCHTSMGTYLFSFWIMYKSQCFKKVHLWLFLWSKVTHTNPPFWLQNYIS